MSGWYRCSGPDFTHECRDRDRTVLWNETVLYEMDVTSGDMRELFTIPSDVESVAVSEDGKEIMLMTKVEAAIFEARWEPRENQFGNILPVLLNTSHREYQDCSVEWRSTDGGDVLAAAPFKKTCFVHQNTLEGSTRTIDWRIGTMAP